MAEEIFDANDLPADGPPGNSPDRFQVLVRLEKGLSQQALNGIANAQGGRIEKLVISENSALAGGKGSVFVLSFPDTPARENIVSALARRPGVEVAELDSTQHALLASTDTHYASGAMWGMLGPSGDGIGAFSNAFGTGADAAWANSGVSADGKVGSMRTVVGVIDTGIDPLHPDLYLNIWINQNEIPVGVATDQDGDGVITFRDLNVKVSNVYVNAVSDVNGNGRIDADDILRLPAWANGIDNDSNGYLDDLFGWDFNSNDNRPFESYDGTGTTGNPSDSYHGTHVAGTIGALANGTGVVGVVWDVQIMPLRFIGPSGTGGTTSDAIEAIYYYSAMGQSHPGLNFVGTNNSWGGGSSSALLAGAIQTAGNNGHLFFVAAGNDATNNNLFAYYPSSYAVTSTFKGVTYDPLVSVASITNTGALSSFSNYGATAVDIAAPGSTIASTFAGNEWFSPPNYSYANLNGTSMATPHVTGTAALIASEFPGLHPADLKAAILNGRTAYAALNGVVATGGRLNIPGSMALVGPAPVITVSDPLLSLADASAAVTITFPEAVTNFTAADITVTSGHGSISGLATTNNIVWTATFTPTNVETQAARILVGNRFTAANGDFGREGASTPFAIDRIAPAATIASIAATRDGTGADVDGTLSAALGSGEVLKVFRDAALLGNATVTGTNWHFDDTSALANGTYQYTARAFDAVGNQGTLSNEAPLLVATYLPAPSITINDTLLSLADASATVTFTFSEAVTGFDGADISVTSGHGSISGLTTANNIVWTATFTPSNVETQAARVSVGNGYTSSLGGKLGTAGESDMFAIDRIAPAATIASIAATRDGTGANVDGTLSAALGSGEVLKVYRDSTLLGNATVTTTSWHFDDTTALANGTYDYTARALDAAGNQGTPSGPASLVVATYLPAPSIAVSDSLLSLADTSATVTFTFSEAVTGFDALDISVTPGHGAITGLATANNIVWTATFTPSNVETQTARVSVGNQYTSSLGGKLGTAGESALFAIDRIAPAATIASIAATRDGTGANVDGTLSAALGSGEVLKVYRDSTLLGNATVTTTSWHFDDTTALVDGTYQYTARAFDAAGNQGTQSSPTALQIATTDNAGNTLGTATALTLGNTASGSVGVGTDTDDFFWFTANGSGRVTANLTGLSTDIDLRALNSTGTQIVAGVLSGAASESIGFDVVQGQTYYLHVDPYLAVSSNYSLATNFTPSSTGTTAPEVTVLGNAVSIVDGDTTPAGTDHTDFGSVAVGGAGVTRTFTVRNDGTATLTLSSLTLPTGFTLANSNGLVASLAPGATDTFQVLMSAASAGTKTGQITFTSNDADESPFNFTISGVVTSTTTTTDFALALGVTNAGYYGRGFNGTNDADGKVTGSFTGANQNLKLSLSGYDVDTTTEMRVLLNGAHFAYLSPTPNNSTGLSEFTILASQQQVGTNVLTFVNSSAANTWGVTDLLIAPATIA